MKEEEAEIHAEFCHSQGNGAREAVKGQMNRCCTVQVIKGAVIYVSLYLKTYYYKYI